MQPLEAAFVTVALLVTVRFLVPVSDEPEPWSPGDAALALAAGLGFAALSTLWLPAYSLRVAALTASDFSQYCDSVGAVQAGHLDQVNIQRSMYASLLPGFLARGFGVLGGLMLAAIISQVVTGVGLFLWARVLAGRVAGLTAVILALSMTPLVLLSRTVTFYPQVVAVFVLAAAATTAVGTLRTMASLVLAGAAAGLALLWDPRGLYWAVPALAVGSVVAVLRVSPRQWIARLAALHTPVALSWALARQYTPPQASGLTRQTAAMVSGALGHKPPDAGHDLVWGVSPLLEMPAQIWQLLLLNLHLGDGARVVQGASWLAPWAIFLIPAGLSSAFWLKQRRGAFAVLWTASLPFAATLASATASFGHIRYFALGFPLVPVILGVGLVIALRGSTGRLLAARFTLPVVTVVLLLLVLGVIPNWLSPVASWRTPLVADAYPAALLKSPPAATPEDAGCVRLLAADRASSRTGWSYAP